MSAAGVIKNTFAEQGIDLASIAMTANPLLPEDTKRETARRAAFNAAAGEVAPGMAAFGEKVVFGDLWFDDRAGSVPREPDWNAVLRHPQAKLHLFIIHRESLSAHLRPICIPSIFGANICKP